MCRMRVMKHQIEVPEQGKGRDCRKEIFKRKMADRFL